MRVVLLTETFTKNMGYAGMMLPKYLARFGVDVHVVSLGLPPYYQINDFQSTYGNFTASNDFKPDSIESYNGYTLHVLPHKLLFGYPRMLKLREKLKSISPNVVQTFAAIGLIPMEAALLQIFLKYKLFTGNHTTASVFPLSRKKIKFIDKDKIKNVITRELHGRIISYCTEKCYCATKDCGDIAANYFGVQINKIEIAHLGVDTDLFFMDNSNEAKAKRLKLRKQLGVSPTDIVCIYTGRLSNEKNPLILAKAVEKLIKVGEPFKALFVGHGIQAEQIKKCLGSKINPFVAVEELPDFYRASDIGVWPTQESTSMLDAAACGLPVIVNDTLAAVERIDGNGIIYQLNNLNSMIDAIKSLSDPKRRLCLGENGANKMANKYSWNLLANKRLRDYELALKNKQ